VLNDREPSSHRRCTTKRYSFFIFMLAMAAPTPAWPQAVPNVVFTVRSSHSGRWSDPNTWSGRRIPKSGDYVQIRTGHSVLYDADSDQPLRMVHVAGTLRFDCSRSTRMEVALLKIQAGESTTEDGFNCAQHDGTAPSHPSSGPRPALEIGNAVNPIPANVAASIRLVHFPGADRETLPAIINCGGRWDVHGAPLSRTWVKLGAPAKSGEIRLELSEPVTGWKAGDHVIVTASKEVDLQRTFRPGAADGVQGNTEDRTIRHIDGAALTLDRPLSKDHSGAGPYRCEVANLSRNVVIESVDPNGVRGHTMFHTGSTGSLSYAEFRHLGKENVLGKYPIHFHLAGASMRGSSILGVSVWDSRNRWITIHGTDYLLVRDCVGYQSVGHGFFLEDGTEQYNILDRNLAVQAYRGRPLPKQVLSFDPNDGAGFWWANGRNSFTRNVSCENDEYGYRFDIEKRSNFDPVLELRTDAGSAERRDVRTLPFLRFEDNESHSEGLYSFNFGEDEHPSVRGDRSHPYIARNLKAWETHYVLRPNLQFFLMDGLDVFNGVYGVYHPDYDAHVYRNITLNNVISEPINRGHDDESIQYGDFTYENLTFENCRIGRDPLIQLTCTSPKPGVSGHFRHLILRNSGSHDANVVDLGGGPRNDKLENSVAYYFHDYPAPGSTLKVESVKFTDLLRGGEFKSIDGFTGKDVRAARVIDVPFPILLNPVDDLPPATIITEVRRARGVLQVSGISQDNGEIAYVMVNGHKAKILRRSAGLAEWVIILAPPRDGSILAVARDTAGNDERTGHRRSSRLVGW
jgi:hypothetical protein